MSEDLNKLRERALETLSGHPDKNALPDLVLAWLANKAEGHASSILSLLARLQAAEERAEKVEGAMLNVQQQCENVVFNLRQRPYGALSNKDAMTIFDRLATTLRVAALKTEGA